ncbi:MAG: LysE family transporter [Bacteroidota bacterium]
MSAILTIFAVVSFAQPMALFQGYLYGLTLILLIGPVFFTLLQNTWENGFKSGFTVALGIVSGDALCVALLFGLGVSGWFLETENQFWLGLIGAIILLVLGTLYTFRSPRTDGVQVNLKAGTYLNAFVQGFVVNFFNPFAFAVWIGAIALASSLYETTYSQSVFLGGMLMAILTTDTLKVGLAHYIRPLLKTEWLNYIFKGIGVILCLSGMYLLFRVF